MINLYWPVYKNLERAVLDMAEYIHFDDMQSKTYSMKIGDLIVRCAVEIESIVKELYLSEGGNANLKDENDNNRDLYFDTDCIEFLNQKWSICSKKIMVSATNFYFTEERFKTLMPLYKANKRGSSGSKWKQAYQKVKHDRKNQLKYANIENLIQSLGALFILNIYYKNECVELETGVSKWRFDEGCGSDIFSVYVCDATQMAISGEACDDSIQDTEKSKIIESIYVIKYSDDSLNEMRKKFDNANKKLVEELITSPKVKKYLQENTSYKVTNLPQLCADAGVENILLNKFARATFQEMQKAKREAVLCKGLPIYHIENK